MEKSGGLTAKIDDSNSVVAFGMLSVARERDHFFNERPKLFCLLNGGNDVFLISVDKRGRKIAKHRHTMLGRASKFTMCFLMSHVLKG